MIKMTPETLAQRLFGKLLRAHCAALTRKPHKPRNMPWQSAVDLLAYMGKPPGAGVTPSRHKARKPHGVGNTCWSSQESEALYKAPATPIHPRKPKPEKKVKKIKPVRQFRRDKQEKRKKTRIPPDYTFTCPIDNEQVRLLRVELGIPT